MSYVEPASPDSVAAAHRQIFSPDICRRYRGAAVVTLTVDLSRATPHRASPGALAASSHVVGCHHPFRGCSPRVELHPANLNIFRPPPRSAMRRSIAVGPVGGQIQTATKQRLSMKTLLVRPACRGRPIQAAGIFTQRASFGSSSTTESIMGSERSFGPA